MKSNKHSSAVPVDGLLFVSVVLPVFNGQQYVANAIASVLSQTERRLEIIVVDDASADKTSEVVNSFRDNRLIYIKLPNNVGPAAARNIGIKQCKADYVAFIDADDCWASDKLERQLERIFVDCEISLLSTNGIEIYPNQTSEPLLKVNPEQWGCDWKDLLRESQIATPTVLTRKNLLEQLGGFDESLQVGEDQDLWIRLGQLGKLAWIDEDLVEIVKREDSYNAERLALEQQDVLGLIKKHLIQNASIITRRERRDILAHRYGQFARNAYARGQYACAARLFLQQLTQRPSNVFQVVMFLVANLSWVQRIRAKA